MIQCLLPSAVTWLGSPAKLSGLANGRSQRLDQRAQVLGRDGSNPVASSCFQGLVTWISRRGFREAPLREASWWGRKDSNLRSHEAADLQSAPFATRDTSPLNSIATTAETAKTRPLMTLKPRTRSRAPGRRVYGRSTPPKSTKARPPTRPQAAQIAILRNP